MRGRCAAVAMLALAALAAVGPRRARGDQDVVAPILSGTWSVSGSYVGKSPAGKSQTIGYAGEVTFTPAPIGSFVHVRGMVALKTGEIARFEAGAEQQGATLAIDALLSSPGMSSVLAGPTAKPTRLAVSYTWTAPQNAREDDGQSKISSTWRLSTGLSGTEQLWREAELTPGRDPAVAHAIRLGFAEKETMRGRELARFGVTPHRWLSYLTMPGSDVFARDVRAAAAHARISPVWLMTLAIGEGLNSDLDSQLLQTSTAEKFSVSGFGSLGVDDFVHELPTLKTKKLIPATWRENVDYTPTTDTNELNREVTSADFPDLTHGLTALAAVVADRRDRFIADAREIWGASATSALSADDIRFWTYLDFNIGSGGRRSAMRKHGPSWGRRWDGDELASNNNGRFNAILRVSTARWIDDLGIFHESEKPAH